MPGFSYPAPVGNDARGGHPKENDNQGNTGPKVGSIYNGSTVVDIQIEVSDRGARIRKRSIIKLENGAILKEDHWKDKVFQEVDTARRRAPTRPHPITDNDTNPATASGGPIRGLGPKTKSGRHLPKPVAPPRRGTQGVEAGALQPMRAESPARKAGRRSSRGDDFIPGPVRPSKSSDLETMQVSSNNHRGRRSSNQGAGVSGTDGENRDLSPEPTSKPSSFRNMSNFLISPIRQAPKVSKSSDSLDAMKAMLYSPGSARNPQLPPKGDAKRGRRTSATARIVESTEDGAAPATPQSKPRSLKLSVLMSPRSTPQRSKSGELEQLQGICLSPEQHSKSEPFKLDKSILATPESNKEKLRSFKALIAMPSPKRYARSPSPASMLRKHEQSPRRDSLQQAKFQQSPEQSPSPRRGSITTEENTARVREPSLSPVEVKKPSSSSYLTSFLDSLYDSYVAPKGSDDEDSDGGCGRGLLESSLNKFVEWAE